jgi:hypothetical protein
MLLWLVSGKQPFRRRKGASGRQSASVGACSSPRSLGQRGHISRLGSRGYLHRRAMHQCARSEAREPQEAGAAVEPPKSTDSLSAKLSANQRTLWQHQRPSTRCRRHPHPHSLWMGTTEIIFGHDVPATVKPEEFGESTIGKRRHKRAPECAYLLSPLRARPWNRRVSIDAAAICQPVTGAKEPVKAAKEAAGKVFASPACPAQDPSRFWLNRGRAMPKSPCCGSSS